MENELFNNYLRDVPPERWGFTKYPDNEQRVIAWQKYYDSTGARDWGPHGRIPDYETWLRENGHTEEANRREDEQRRAEMAEATRKETEKQKIIAERRGTRRCFGNTATIHLAHDEVEKIIPYLRIALGAPNRRSMAGGMAWDDHGIILTDDHRHIQTARHGTEPSDYGKQIMDNVWKILEGE